MARYQISFGTLLLVSVLLAGCGSSSRTSIDGYDDSMLKGKRIFVLLPAADDLVMNNPASFAASRGVAPPSARELLYGEMRTNVVREIGARLDSNTVLNYLDQSVGAMHPLDAEDDFADGTPTSWDKIGQAARAGNIDYLVVLSDFTIANAEPSGEGRGKESITAGYALLDVAKRTVMTKGTFSFSVDDPRTIAMSYQRLASELTRKLPFAVYVDETH